MLRRGVPFCPLFISSCRFQATSVEDAAFERLARSAIGSTTLNPSPSLSDKGMDEATLRTLHRIQLDSLSERDPLGGMAHPDYYRNPLQGYAPQFAPRQFALGGRVSAFAPETSLTAAMATGERADSAHRRELFRQQQAAKRTLLRSMKASDTVKYLDSQCESTTSEVAALKQVNESRRPQDIFAQVVCPQTRASYMADHGKLVEYELAKATSRGLATAPTGARAGLPVREARASATQSRADHLFAQLEDVFRELHGLREQERFEHAQAQRTARRPFNGYDLDRVTASKQQILYGQSSFDPLLPPSSMREAQQQLRKHAATEAEQTLAKEIYRNTTQEAPKTGASLTESVLATVRLAKKQHTVEEQQRRSESLGLGRQAPLSQETGPDKRVQRLHKNDERLLRASFWGFNSYRDTAAHRYVNGDIQSAHDRNDTTSGIGASVTNRFDAQRREMMRAAGLPDIAEQRTLYYGTPIKQQIDTYVRSRRNAKSERPDGYFAPFPSSSEQRLLALYRDVEGFPLMRGRPEFLEFELLARYRAHHQQRRMLALKNGLEPVRGETVAERDIRRSKLDALCEGTPFDGAKMSVHQGEMRVDAETLRRHFGAFFLPSPTACQRLLSTGTISVATSAEGGQDTTTIADTREHFLSSRYFNQLLLNTSYQARIRTNTQELQGRAPDPDLAYELPEEVQTRLSDRERALYHQYVARRVAQHESLWRRAAQHRRWIAEHGCYGTLHSSDLPVEVIDAVGADGSIQTIPTKPYASAISKARQSGEKAGDSSLIVSLDGAEYQLDLSTVRQATPVTIQLDGAGQVVMEEADFLACPLEVDVEPNAPSNPGLPSYHYNRNNYIETQDSIWEEQTYNGVEGWTKALPSDGLKEGLVVQARRRVTSREGKGEYQRAEVVQFQQQPFFNPAPQTISVRFIGDGTIEEVPLTDVLVWQLSPMGPERAVPDETRRHNPSLRRYVDVADPKGEKKQPPHFLDKYRPPATRDTFRSVKQITDLDGWSHSDEIRADNHRPLSIAHRHDYVSRGYVPYYTPWDWIITQEADAPLFADQARSADNPTSFLFQPNRYWRWKRRAHGYLQYFGPEIRDLMTYIDQVTPWKKAQKIRTLWEVREHHPMPKYHRPQLAMHRNTAGLLPTHLWEVDKKTGRVKTLKENVRDYQTLTPYPSWVQL